MTRWGKDTVYESMTTYRVVIGDWGSPKERIVGMSFGHIDDHFAKRGEIDAGLFGNFWDEAVRSHTRNGIDFEEVRFELSIGEEIDSNDAALAVESKGDLFGFSAQVVVERVAESGRGEVFGVVAVVFRLVVVEFRFWNDAADAESFSIEHGDGEFVIGDAWFEEDSFVWGEGGVADGVVDFRVIVDPRDADAGAVARRFDDEWIADGFDIAPACIVAYLPSFIEF